MGFSNSRPLQFFVNGAGMIEVTVANTVELVNSSISELRRILVLNEIKLVGLDCEWRPNTVAGQVPNKVATLQLCTNYTCVVIQLCYLNHIPESLYHFLNDPQIIFVGVKVEEDCLKLRNDYGLLVNNTEDIGDLALKKGFQFIESNVGLKKVASEVSNIEIDKPERVRRSDWQSRNLRNEQIKYAAIDAFASFAVGYELLVEGVVPPPYELLFEGVVPPPS